MRVRDYIAPIRRYCSELSPRLPLPQGRAAGRLALCLGCLAVFASQLALAVGPQDVSRAALYDLPRLGGPQVRRQASYDRKGANEDYRVIQPGATLTIFNASGPACIRWLWCTLDCKEDDHLRKLVLRMFWDGEKEPSVEAPLGDFFCLGHAQYYDVWSLPISAIYGKGLNCYLPMPFNTARIQITNEGTKEVRKFYYQVHYEVYDKPLPSDWGRLHAQWRRDPATTAGGADYLILEAQGRGRYIGCNLSVHASDSEWWGEGDERIYIDSDAPTLLGTGAEDYFGAAWGFTKPFSAPYSGAWVDSKDVLHAEKFCAFRFHVEDPIVFSQKIKVTIEHGNQNSRTDDYASTAYWYQTEPHQAFPKLLAVEERLPKPRREELPEEEKPTPIVKIPTPSPEPERGDEPFPLSELDVLRLIVLCVWAPVGIYYLVRAWRKKTAHQER